MDIAWKAFEIVISGNQSRQKAILKKNDGTLIVGTKPISTELPSDNLRMEVSSLHALSN